jgi:arginase
VNGLAQGRRIGMIWVDARRLQHRRDYPIGNIRSMSVAALAGRGHPRWPGCSAPARCCATDVAMVGITNVDSLERLALRDSGITSTMHDVDRRGLPTVMEEAIACVSAETAGFHVSFDMDSLDPSEAPGVGTPVLGGIFYREAHLAMELVAESGRLIGLDLVEVNPILDARNVTAELAVQFALSALGKRIL